MRWRDYPADLGNSGVITKVLINKRRREESQKQRRCADGAEARALGLLALGTEDEHKPGMLAAPERREDKDYSPI